MWDPGSQLVVLLSADSAALGLWEGGNMTQHKVLTGYTVRRSRGGSQLSYMQRSVPGLTFSDE
jgi:hypothetical protein